MPTALQACRIHPLLAQAQAFTAAYRSHRDAHPAQRELACLREQYPALMGPIGSDDVFAGARAEHRICYVGTMWFTHLAAGAGAAKQGGYCFDFAADQRYDWSVEERAIYGELSRFWETEYTCAKTAAALDPRLEAFTHQHGQVRGGAGCGFCIALDMDRLLRRGLPGLREDIRVRRQRATADETPFLAALEGLLDLILDVGSHYRREVRDRVASCVDEAERLRLLRIDQSLGHIAEQAPETLHQAMQLLWLYSILAGGLHIEAWRIDVALGDFFARDIDTGRLSEEQATAMVHGLWRMWQANGDPAVCRMTIGGRGRRNEKAADRFCLAAMEATRRHCNRIPQLSLRFHQDQDPELMRKAFSVIGEGCVFPVLYNDDAILPGVERALHVDARSAEAYHPLGCGEYMLGNQSPSLLNFVWSVPKTLDAALRGGRDAEGNVLGPQESAINDQGTSAEIAARIDRQAAMAADILAAGHRSHVQVLGQECAFLFASLLSDDCLERGRSLLDGGVRHVGACVMGHGFTNAGDALHAIQELVLRQRRYRFSEILPALADDFAHARQLRQDLRAVAKFGNDVAEVDQVVNELWCRLSRHCDQAGRRHGLDFFTLSSVNPGGYAMGENCGATADGRLAGEPFAIGNAPTAGNDRCGLSALLTSLARIDAANGGSVSNIKLARSLFAENRAKLECLFAVYWRLGGIQANISVVDQDELIDAMAHPERYPHLLVRLGGWTARFVQLERRQQEEIIRRSCY